MATPAAYRPGEETIAIGLDAEPRSLDPHTSTALNDFRVVMNVYEGLVRFADGSLDISPGLAEAWTTSADGLRYSFALRRGVRFHDGSPFDAEAVKFNFDRMLREDHPYHDTGPFPLAFFFSKISEVRVDGPHLVTIVLDEPYAPLLANLAYPTGLMVSPAAVRRHGKDYGRHPSGTGPFRFVEWESARRIVLERNDDYWGRDARSRRLVFRPITDVMTRVAELRGGGLDIVPELSPDHVSWFRAEEDFTVHESVGPHVWFLILNTRDPPFSDIRMRRAVNYAVDKQALVEHVLQHTATVAAGPVPKAFDWAYNEDVEPYPHDPERARELIREAGYGDGVEVVFYVPTSGSGMLAPVEMATAIQADLAAVGIRVRIETYEWNTYLDKVNSGLGGGADLAEMAWMTNDPDTLPFLTLRSAAHPPEGFNSGYFSNERVDRLLEQARVSTDRQERARLYREVQALVHEQAPWLFVASWKQNAVVRDRVRDFELQPSFFLLLGATYKESG
ncbi:MAG: ABC transporter substrate-binding protein [Gammaproteobacteria bacterium]|nr:ABC transporter substrate-binding protein [Gammaproteobacteria bacterium]